MKRKLFLPLSSLVLLLGGHSMVYAQQCTNIAGASAKTPTLQHAYSIGEMVIVETSGSATLTVTQGILQPDAPLRGVTLNDFTEQADVSGSLKIYPNPTRQLLVIEAIAEFGNEASCQLLDAMGNVLISKDPVWKPLEKSLTLDLNSFAAGNYFLVFRHRDPHGDFRLLSYKIQKTN